MERSEQITELLGKWRSGDRAALDRLVPLVQSDLLHIARARLARERQHHTLQTSALVNEAYVRLLGQRQMAWQDRAHFFAVAAQVMRHVLVDYAKERHRTKRRGAAIHIEITDELVLALDQLEEVLAIDEALERLAAIDPRKSQVVEMRFFAGLDVKETAEALGVAPNTVIRDWQFARAWLRTQLTSAPA
jgi:RNA polymerase sigma factor (TIGR02999 family)